ncbi:precorrin-6y C5,15-methyltransferase (decarboxylating) subunit CbiE [Alloyangia pacifica]|uniref:Precorrin-6Y C5,15-methyltransferase (Decarboxylating) n=1 Tax=Alloyangia pacifica TaxID=311180 RepID=A0A1I6VSY6_9RHOB|nr:precorrin-6y C5,15-methyltransferase (decarboxylating) subunit CbiE [Alloyangia pacifica]SDI12187.1 precorrin-6Y C5,15-methyltransferase (decarboxylating) [Alloyangia pacifica]SFT16524.1 precorrin-6Y C5,15-methyltransferase (decarboxylating) [Alloyangia pacifica]
MSEAITSKAPWLSIIGLGEDGPDGLCAASRAALAAAEIVIGPARHLSLLPDGEARQITWPVPFVEGIPQLLSLRGRQVAVLASGDPFWFGAGSVLARHLDRGDWQAFPGRSTFSLAAARMSWPLEGTSCFGLHAVPLARLRPQLAPGRQMIVLLRDGAAVAALANYLAEEGFGASEITVMEALGGPRERLTQTRADTLPVLAFAHPVCVALTVRGDGPVLPLATGRPDDWFESDGQITKRPVRALTLSALTPRPFEHLWDIGGGSGSIGIEWLLCDPTLSASTIEPRADRAARIAANAARLGAERLRVIEGRAPEALAELERPDAVFIGGGLSRALLDWLEAHLPSGTRVVANAVTLESEALLAEVQARLGGELLRIELSSTQPLGARRGWKAAYPIVQWSHVT